MGEPPKDPTVRNILGAPKPKKQGLPPDPIPLCKDEEKVKLFGKGDDTFCPQVVQPEKYELKSPSIDPKTKEKVALPATKVKQTPLELLKLKKGNTTLR